MFTNLIVMNCKQLSLHISRNQIHLSSLRQLHATKAHLQEWVFD